MDAPRCNKQLVANHNLSDCVRACNHVHPVKPQRGIQTVPTTKCQQALNASWKKVGSSGREPSWRLLTCVDTKKHYEHGGEMREVQVNCPVTIATHERSRDARPGRERVPEQDIIPLWLRPHPSLATLACLVWTRSANNLAPNARNA